VPLTAKGPQGSWGEQRPFVTDCNGLSLSSHWARQRAERAVKKKNLAPGIISPS
jgi:hypothetical protein